MSAQEYIWDLLAKRERQRVAISATRKPQTQAEVFYSVAESSANRPLNRYANIYAYDRTAVTVDGDYLNANVIKDGHGRWWVACQVSFQRSRGYDRADTQAPLPHTIDTFLRAIHGAAASRHPLVKAETNGAIIVQLTGDTEGGARKADPYLTYARSSPAPLTQLMIPDT
jgi:protein-tyrosine phosphatase